MDALRGLAVVVMALDHARDFYAPALQPEDLATTTPVLFFTRWITHYCAPAFVLLAGLGAALRARSTTRGAMTRFLLSRGLWLIVLELTVVRFGWTLSVGGSYYFVQVIWAIGVSMILLAGLVWVPRWAVVAFASAVILGHDALRFIQPPLTTWGQPPASDAWTILWTFLHGAWNSTRIGPLHVDVVYAILPWAGVMALGYGLGPLYAGPAPARRRWLAGLGLAMVAAFALVRGVNAYGDPAPWSEQSRGPVYTAISFLACTKYPASLAYLMMTLGPTLLLLAGLELVRGRAPGAVMGVLASFGRAPLFFYVLHLPLLTMSAGVIAYLRFGREALGWGIEAMPPAGYTVGLWPAYAAWASVVALLYPPCRWFAALKRARPGWWWLSYL